MLRKLNKESLSNLKSFLLKIQQIFKI